MLDEYSLTRLAAVISLFSLCCAGDVNAQSEPGDRADTYVQTDGYAPASAKALTDLINTTLADKKSPASVRLPSADVDPVTMGVLALDLSEPEIRRARYRASLSTVAFETPPGGETPYSFVELSRFNLGPAVRKALVEAHGEDNVAPAEAFPDGPHVSWRLVTRPIMGNRAMIVAAGRKTVSGEEAAGASCLDAPCLSAGSAIGEVAPWGRMKTVAPEGEPLQQSPENASLTPASVSDILFASLAPVEAKPADPTGLPAQIEALIETGLGQDPGVAAAARQLQRDDSITATWQRVASLSGDPVNIYQATAYECARGPEFAEPGSFCP